MGLVVNGFDSCWNKGRKVSKGDVLSSGLSPRNCPWCFKLLTFDRFLYSVRFKCQCKYEATMDWRKLDEDEAKHYVTDKFKKKSYPSRKKL